MPAWRGHTVARGDEVVENEAKEPRRKASHSPVVNSAPGQHFNQCSTLQQKMEVQESNALAAKCSTSYSQQSASPSAPLISSSPHAGPSSNRVRSVICIAPVSRDCGSSCSYGSPAQWRRTCGGRNCDLPELRAGIFAEPRGCPQCGSPAERIACNIGRFPAISAGRSRPCSRE